MSLAANVIAALGLLSASAPDLVPGPATSPAEATGADLAVRDGDRLIRVARAPTDRARVRLTWPDGRSARARVGPDAVVRVADPAALPARDLALVAPLMARAGIYRVRSLRPGEDGLAAAARLADDSAIDILPDLALARVAHRIDIPPDDPRHPGQWYLHTIDIHAAWAIEDGDPDVVIGVVDDGCDMAHADLADHMEPGLDLVDGDDDPSYLPGAAGNEHGTACAGLIAAVGDNGVGIAGTCPECHLRCVRLLPASVGGEVPIGNDIAAYDQQLAWGVAVSSNSWGFEDHFPVPNLLKVAITQLISEGRGGRGTVVVFAAGNEAREVQKDELYGIDGVLTVGAINAFDEAASFSNSGKPVDLVAPAGTLTTDISGRDGADPGDYTGLFGGTSSACPIAAGVAALLVAAAPERSAYEIVDTLVATTRPAPFAVPDPKGHDLLYGYGVIDPAAALRAILGATDPADQAPETTPEPETEAAPEAAPEAGIDPTTSDDTEVAEVAETAPPAAADEGGGCHGAPPVWCGWVALIALGRRRRRGARR